MHQLKVLGVGPYYPHLVEPTDYGGVMQVGWVHSSVHPSAAVAASVAGIEKHPDVAACQAQTLDPASAAEE